MDVITAIEAMEDVPVAAAVQNLGYDVMFVHVSEDCPGPRLASTPMPSLVAPPLHDFSKVGNQVLDDSLLIVRLLLTIACVSSTS
jgi:hypothetical protein